MSCLRKSTEQPVPLFLSGAPLTRVITVMFFKGNHIYISQEYIPHCSYSCFHKQKCALLYTKREAVAASFGRRNPMNSVITTNEACALQLHTGNHSFVESWIMCAVQTNFKSFCCIFIGLKSQNWRTGSLPTFGHLSGSQDKSLLCSHSGMTLSPCESGPSSSPAYVRYTAGGLNAALAPREQP